jgi:hypothetical protein
MSIHFSVKIDTLQFLGDQKSEPFEDQIAMLELGNSRQYRSFVMPQILEECCGTKTVSSKESVLFWLMHVRQQIPDCRLTSAIAYILALPEEEPNEFEYKFHIIWG